MSIETTIKKVTPEMKEALIKPLPTAAIKPHPTKTYLSSIKAIYVTERLSDVFGIGAWNLSTEHVITTAEGMVVCKTLLSIPEYGIYYESFGGSDNGGERSKNFDLGDAYKGATTDAITKIASYLGIGIDVFKGNPNAAPKVPEQPKVTPPKTPAKKEALLSDRKAAALVEFQKIDFSKVVGVLVRDYKIAAYTKLEDFIAGETIERILEVYAKVK